MPNGQGATQPRAEAACACRIGDPLTPAETGPTGWRAWQWTFAAACYGIAYAVLRQTTSQDEVVGAMGRMALLPVSLLVFLLALRVATGFTPRGHVRQEWLLFATAANACGDEDDGVSSRACSGWTRATAWSWSPRCSTTRWP